MEEKKFHSIQNSIWKKIPKSWLGCPTRENLLIWFILLKKCYWKKMTHTNSAIFRNRLRRSAYFANKFAGQAFKYLHWYTGMYLVLFYLKILLKLHFWNCDKKFRGFLGLCLMFCCSQAMHDVSCIFPSPTWRNSSMPDLTLLGKIRWRCRQTTTHDSCNLPVGRSPVSVLKIN